MTKLATLFGLATLFASSALAADSWPHSFSVESIPAEDVPYIVMACAELSRDPGVGCTPQNLENATVAISFGSSTYCVDFMHVHKTTSTTGEPGRYMYCIDSRTMKIHRFYPQ